MKIIHTLVPVCLLATTLQAQAPRMQFNRETVPVRKARVAASAARYAKVELSDVVGRKERRDGQLVSVMAEVLAYDARLNTLELYDARSRAVVNVSLAQVSRATRQALAVRPATDVTVYGKVTTQQGRPVIVAHKLELVLLEAESK